MGSTEEARMPAVIGGYRQVAVPAPWPALPQAFHRPLERFRSRLSRSGRKPSSSRAVMCRDTAASRRTASDASPFTALCSKSWRRGSGTHGGGKPGRLAGRQRGPVCIAGGKRLLQHQWRIGRLGVQCRIRAARQPATRLPGYPAYRCRGRRLAVSGRQTQGAAKPIHKMKLLHEKYGGGIDEGRLETLDARRPRHGVRRQGHLRTI